MISYALLVLFAWQPPPGPPAACRQGVALFEKGDAAGALAALGAATDANPQSAYCAKALGVVHAAIGDYRGAEAPFRRACQLNAAEPDACYYWARALYSLDRFEESLVALAKAAPMATKGWWILTAKGQTLDALGRSEAESVLKQALADRRRDPLPPQEPDPLLALAAFFYREGRGAEALALLRDAPLGYRKMAAYHYQTGRALAQAGLWQEAANALSEAVALRDAYPEAHGLLSRCYHRLGRGDLAERHTAKARGLANGAR